MAVAKNRSEVHVKVFAGLALLSALAVVSPALASAPSDSRDVQIINALRIGHWVEVRGVLRTSDQFLAERIALVEPQPQSRLWGTAEEGSNQTTLTVLGRTVEIRASTSFKSGDSAAVLGQRVRVLGHLGVGGRILADRIEVRTAGVERILGRIDEITRTEDQGLRLSILGFSVTVPSTAKQRANAPISTFARTPPTPLSSPFSKLVDADDLLGEGFLLGHDTSLKVVQDISFNSRRNFEIDDRDDTDIDERDDRDDATHNLRLQLTWTPSARTAVLIDTRHRLRRRELDSSVSQTSDRTRIAEAWFLIRDIGLGIDLLVGRQDHDEDREWLYDQNLDGIRLFRQTRRLHFELGLTTSLNDASSRDQDAVNSILYVSNREGPGHFAGYLVHRNFGGGRDITQTHYGVRAFGRWTPRLRSWTELSGLTGERGTASVAAWGTDVGLSLSTLGPAKATVSVGWAMGSGDRAGGTNTEFRQTGLQDNNARLGGLSAVRYYGELLDPELSNLRIATLGFATRLFGRNSIELIGHAYEQDTASTRLRNTNLDRRPLGISKTLGWEVDLVFSIRQFAQWDIEIVGAHFHPGAAFPAGDDAQLARVQVRFRY